MDMLLALADFTIVPAREAKEHRPTYSYSTVRRTVFTVQMNIKTRTNIEGKKPHESSGGRQMNASDTQT